MGRLISRDVVANRLGISGNTVLRMEKAGTLPRPVVVGVRSVRHDEDEIESILAAKKAARERVA